MARERRLAALAGRVGPSMMLAAPSATLASGRRPLAGIAAMAGWASASIGALALLGWVAYVPVLTQVSPGWNAMRVSTALSFILCGLALVALTRPDAAPRYKNVALWGALLISVLGIWTLGECLAGVTPSIDRALAGLLLRSDVLPGRVSPIAALNFALGGCSLIGLGLR